MAEKKSTPASTTKFESKKPKKKGSNSGASLDQRAGLKNSVGMMARYCDTAFKDIEVAIASGAKYDEDVNRFPKEPILHFNEKTREIECMDLAELRKMERALQIHSKLLDSVWKKVRPQRSKDSKKSAPGKRKGNPSNPFQKDNRVAKPKSSTQRVEKPKA